MNQIDIEGIRARADKATPGPWEYDDDGLQVFVSLTQTYIADVWSNDTPFIAHARQDIPALLDAYTEQAAEIARLEGNCDALNDMYQAAERKATRLEGLVERAVEDMESFGHNIHTCANRDECSRELVAHECCYNCPRWQWRGFSEREGV